MAITTVDNFIRIFKFYQDNPLVRKIRTFDTSTGKPKMVNVTLADIFKSNSLLYQDTIDLYMNCLILNKYSQLDFNDDNNTIQLALNAREKMSKYFTKVLYPGSYAFNTTDNSQIRKMLLDWTSTIKTIQDANKRVTNAYSLSSDDVDKAIKGFGINFINSNSLKSIDRRKNFLLNICDLYSIKGTPGSIIKALNIIGLEDIFIREAWLCKDVVKYNGDYDLKMRWEAQTLGQEFDSNNNTYVSLDTHDDMYTTWDWFEEKIRDQEVSTFDPHWFYTKNEIKKINDDSDTFIKLPSITPYFGIEYVSDLDKSIDSMEVLYNEINKQFQNHLIAENTQKTIWCDTYPKRLNSLECYTALVYSLIRLDEHIQYENFKSFLEENKFSVPEFETPYEYLNLIYWVYQNKNDLFSVSYNKLLNDYIPIKSNSYCSYENVLRWWLEKEVTDKDKELIDNPLYIQPRKSETDGEYSDYIILEWDNLYPLGRYSIEELSINNENKEVWTEVVSNKNIYDFKMKDIVRTDWADGGSDNINNYRIVVYHHASNIPDIFFRSPFNFNGNPINTMFDRIIRYNGVSTTLEFYNNEEIQRSFINQSIKNKVTQYSVISGYHESEALNSKIRTCGIRTDVLAWYNYAFNYPANTKTYEDKWMNTNASFYDYIEWSIKDYYDTATHNGCLETNRCQNRKWPLNKKWNWAVDSKYYYINYQGDRWMRCQYQESIDSIPFDKKNIKSYGDRFYYEGKLYIWVGINKWIVIDDAEYLETDWEMRNIDLFPNGKIKASTKLAKDIVVGVIKNDNVLTMMQKDSILTDKTTEEYKENLKNLNQAIIEVYNDPFGNELIATSSYTYEKFLIYLYNARLTLDFETGYIYPVLDGYIDDQNRVYLKCKNVDGSNKWVRFNNTKENIEWTSCDAESIYNDTSLGVLLPLYGLPNRYDSLRILDGTIYNYRKQLLESYEKGEIDDNINLVVVRPYKALNAGSYTETESKYKHEHPTVYQKVPYITTSGSLKIAYTWEPIDANRFHDCMLGINSDLVEWIESKYVEDPQNYVELPNLIAEALNNYLINDLGIDGSLLDLIISHWANSGIVKKIINYYKPKRVRLLFISNVLEGDYALTNNLDTIAVTDADYNYYDLTTYRWSSQFDKHNYSKMNRVRLSQVIHEYMPLEDTIYKDDDSSNKVYSCREISSQDSLIPNIEVYDELVDMNRQIISTRNGNAEAVFYVTGLNSLDDPNINGFYYHVPHNLEVIYSNNSYYFEKAEFITRDSNKKIKSTKRWAIFSANDNEYNKDNAFYVAEYESENPWINDDGTPLKYANCTTHERFISNYGDHVDDITGEFVESTYTEGNFSTDRFIKVNLREIEPVLYFNCFDNPMCNGFYYYDPLIHPYLNNKSVYYNLNGKIISFINTKKYYTRLDKTTDYECDKFWIISDNKEFIDFNDCDYFAFTTNNTDEVDPDIYDINNPDFTKQFYKFNGGNDLNHLDNQSALVGCTINFLQDHIGILKDNENVTSVVYDNYKNFVRNHFNTIELKYKPVAATYCDGLSVRNYYYTGDIISDIDCSAKEDNVPFRIDEFTIDEIGNETGAFVVRSDKYPIDPAGYSKDSGGFYIRCPINNSINRSVSIRIKFLDDISINNYFKNNDGTIIKNHWYMLTLTKTKDTYIFYVDGEANNNLGQKLIVSSSKWSQYKNAMMIALTDCNAVVSECAFWDQILPKWYIKNISKFRILRNRPETSRSKTNKSSSNYRPLFATEQPRIVYPKYSTGLPENIIGGRLQEYFADKYKHNREINPLWCNEIPNSLNKNLVVKDAALTQPSRKDSMINDGNGLESTSEYRAGESVAYWWMRYKNKFEEIQDGGTNPYYYKTGVIHHRPVYVSLKQLINDPYPTVRYGQEKKGNYLDIGLTFDGINNVDNSRFDGENVVSIINTDNTYLDDNYDENTNFGNNSKNIRLENYGDTFKEETSTDNIYVLDLAQLSLTQKAMSNGIFHDKLYLYGFSINSLYREFNGVWNHKETVDSWKENDFHECYFKNEYGTKYEAVLTYQRELGYFWWEIRKLSKTDNVWETYFRTYVNARHNQNKLPEKPYDLVNYHQIDLSNQDLCIYDENDIELFKTKCWGEIKQPIIENVVFGSNSWIVFDIESEENNENHPGIERYYDGLYYHIQFDDKWYKVKAENVDNSNKFRYLPDKTPYGYYYADNYLYIWVNNDNGKWIRINTLNAQNLNKIPYPLWKFRKTSSNTVVVNVIDSSNADSIDNSYIDPKTIDIRETYWKFIKFNGLCDYKPWQHLNEEFAYLTSVNNDISLTYTSIQDTLWYKTFEENVNGTYQKVQHHDGTIDFVEEISNTDIILSENKKYIKIEECSNV